MPVIGEGAPCALERDNCPTGQRCTALPAGSVCLASPGSAGLPDASGPDGLDAPDLDAAPASYVSVVLVDQPVAYWRLGDTTLTAVDASGNGATGTYRSGIAQGAPGAIVNDADTSAAFDGVAGTISVGSGFNFVGRAPFSIEAWIRPAIVDSRFRHVFTKERRVTPRQGYGLLVNATEGIVFERFVDDRSIATSVPAPPVGGSFMHIVCVYDGAVLRLYVNGQPASQITDDRAQPAVAELAVIGAASVTESFFAGMIDEVAVYAAALPAPRVQAHYTAGAMPAMSVTGKRP